MRELWQLTRLIRSKNAGPFAITFDIMFKDMEGMRQALASVAISAEAISRIYGVDPSQVRLFVVEDLLTVKISIPRKVFSGDVADTDVYGCQFHGPLVKLPIP